MRVVKADKKPSPLPVGRRTKGRLIDSHPQVKLRRSDRVELCDLLAATGPSARFAIREIMSLIRQYRNNDAVFRSAPPSKTKPLTQFASMARALRQFLIDNRLNFEVDNGDLLAPPGRNMGAERGLIDSDRSLEQMVRRAERAAQYFNGSRRAGWHAKSNSDNPPRKHFLTELTRLWHFDFGMPLRVKAKNGRNEQLAEGLVRLCGICCELAGEARPATTMMRDRIAAILADDPQRLQRGAPIEKSDRVKGK